MKPCRALNILTLFAIALTSPIASAAASDNPLLGCHDPKPCTAFMLPKANPHYPDTFQKCDVVTKTAVELAPGIPYPGIAGTFQADVIAGQCGTEMYLDKDGKFKPINYRTMGPDGKLIESQVPIPCGMWIQGDECGKKL